MIDQKNVTIIIPHLGADQQQADAWRECLRSLDETVPEMTKITATNGSYCTFGEVNLKEQGQCKAVNAAAAIVNTPYIFITNDDMIYAPGWWEKLTNDFESTPVLCPNLVEPRPGAPPFLTHPAGGAGGDFNKQSWLEFARRHNEDSNEVGFNMPLLIKKDLWDMVGGYDINYDPWGSNSDSDLQAKIHLAGVLPVRNRRAIVYHFSQTSGTFLPEHHDAWQRNWAYFETKWGFTRQATDDVWFSKNIIDHEKLTFHPYWEGKYS